VKRVILLFLILLLSSCSRGNYNLLNKKVIAMENRISTNSINIASNSKRIDSINKRLIAIEKRIEEQREKSKTYDDIPPAALIESVDNVQKSKDITSINNKNDKAVYDAALKYYRNFEYTKAKDAFLNFLRVFKTSDLYDNAMFWLADAYLHMGDLNKSEQILKKLIAQYPDKPVTKCGKTDAAMYLLTIIYGKKHDYSNKLYYQNMLKSKFPGSVYAKKIESKTR